LGHPVYGESLCLLMPPVLYALVASVNSVKSQFRPVSGCLEKFAFYRLRNISRKSPDMYAVHLRQLSRKFHVFQVQVMQKKEAIDFHNFVTSPDTDRLSESFHWQTQQYINLQ